MTFFRDRGVWLATVVLVMFAISLLQGAISYTLAFGPLWGLLPRDPSVLATVLLTLRSGLVAVIVLLWALKRKHALFLTVILANAAFTLALMVHTIALLAVLFGFASEALHGLILDVTLMSVANILIFSIWYWVVDAPGVEDIPRADEPWDFLFPQRGTSLPHYEIVGSALCGLSFHRIHDQLCVHSYGHAAADAARQDANVAAGSHLSRHTDRDCRKCDQYPCRQVITLKSNTFSPFRDRRLTATIVAQISG